MTDRPARLALAVGDALAVAIVAFVATFGYALADGLVAFLLLPLSLRIALVFPPLVAALAVGAAASALLAWHRGYWTLSARVHRTVLATLGLAFAWQLSVLGLL